MSNTHEAGDAWETGALGLSAEHAAPAPAGHDQQVDAALGLQLISIRLPKGLIEDLKLIAAKEGLGYQPLVRRVLMRFAAAEFRSMAHEQLVSALCETSPPLEASDAEEEPEKRRACG